jgi:hypothetical protein
MPIKRYRRSKKPEEKDILWIAGRIPDENGSLQVRFRTMGNSMILTIPVPVKTALGIQPGDLAELWVQDGYLVVGRIDGGGIGDGDDDEDEDDDEDGDEDGDGDGDDDEATEIATSTRGTA